MVENEVAKYSDKSKRPTTLPVQSVTNRLDTEVDSLDTSDVDISNEIVN